MKIVLTALNGVYYMTEMHGIEITRELLNLAPTPAAFCDNNPSRILPQAITPPV